MHKSERLTSPLKGLAGYSRMLNLKDLLKVIPWFRTRFHGLLEFVEICGL